MVLEPKYGAYVYQALEFKVGTSLPSEEVKGSSMFNPPKMERYT